MVEWSGSGPHYYAGRELQDTQEDVALGSSVLTVNFFDGNDEEHTVANLSQPVRISLPQLHMRKGVNQNPSRRPGLAVSDSNLHAVKTGHSELAAFPGYASRVTAAIISTYSKYIYQLL